MQNSKTDIDNLRGSTEPRLYTTPKRELTENTSLGFAAIDYANTVLNQSLYPWQEWALIHMLEVEGDVTVKWNFRFKTILLLVSRQNGKTVLSKVIASFFLNVLDVGSVLGVSLSVDKALETLDAVILDQENIPSLSKEIVKVVRSNGGNKLILSGNRTFKIGAPNRKAGRGDSNDLVMLDELREHRNWEVWAAAIASTNARPNALSISFSNAGDPDSIVLRQVRTQAIAEITKNSDIKKDFGGEDVSDLALFEWSAEEDCDSKDIIQICNANPSLGYGQLTLRAVLNNENTFPENKYRSECLCQTVESLLPEPFPKGSWKALLDNSSFIAAQSDLYYGIDMSADRSLVSISVCGLREDGNYHIESIAKRNGTEWAIDWIRSRALQNPIKLAFQGRGAPITGLAEQICVMEGVTRMAIEGPDLTSGWNKFWDSIAVAKPVEEGEVAVGGIKTYHLDQPILDTPAKTMQVKNLGGGLTLPDRGKSPDDISALFAAIMAFSAATRIENISEKKIFRSVYNDDYTVKFI